MSRLLGALLAGRLPVPVRVPVSASLPAYTLLCCPYQSEYRYPRRFQRPWFFAAGSGPSTGIRVASSIHGSLLQVPVRVPVSASLPASTLLCCPYQSEARYLSEGAADGGCTGAASAHSSSRPLAVHSPLSMPVPRSRRYLHTPFALFCSRHCKVHARHGGCPAHEREMS